MLHGLTLKMDVKCHICLLLFLFHICLFGHVDSRKHRLLLEDDDREKFPLSSFGFLKQGTLTVNITKFFLSQDMETIDNNTFGFTLDKSSSLGVSEYVETNTGSCILKQKNPDLDSVKDSSLSIVFFRMDFKNQRMLIERRGKDLDKLLILAAPTPEHVMRRRQAELAHVNVASDSYLFARAKRAAVPPPGKDTAPTKAAVKADPPTVPNAETAGTDGGQGKPENPPSDAGNQPLTKAGDQSQTGTETQTGGAGKQTAGEDGKEDQSESPKTEGATSEKSASYELKSDKEIPLLFDPVTKFYSTYFFVGITSEDQEGMYNLYFHNCQGNGVSIYATMQLVEENNGNFLSAGEIPIPSLFFCLAAVYLVCGIVWLVTLRRSTENVFKMHYLMFAVVLVKSLACLLHAMNSRFIQKMGIHEEAWAVLYYIAYLMRGALFFITILLIGSGWAFIKHVLSDKEKKLFLIVIPLQVLDNIAWIIVEESEEGQSRYGTWKEIFILVDLLCCGAILFPVVWSIRHLHEASKCDGKAAISLTKLKLFRQFYIMVVCYIYFTRIIVYLLKMTVPFRYEWMDDLFRELATILFFVVTGYKFRPATDNPYLQVPQMEEDEIEMDSVVTKSAALDTVKRVNQGLQPDSSTSPKQRECSHEYD